jgi:hypothetical protein
MLMKVRRRSGRGMVFHQAFPSVGS